MQNRTITACGRATVIALQLNNVYAVTVRQAWVSAGWHPPIET
ncbi:HNH endonuclease [Calothrix sp. NIES-4071]|nr:HNH endonuclease [Calothrix sp. NIES-4071]BAZ58158.1 HNH endonuclease [Calothrix sp. NIES-4105]